ncbi:MAG: ABC transporter ATP-binding protein [Verrucomicrobiota bacterium]
MRASPFHFQDLLACIVRLRPHLRGGRYLITAVVGTSICAAALEGIAVALLVPLLSLILNADKAGPMRPIGWVQQLIPGQPMAFYVVVFCGLVLGAIAAKNLIFYLSQFLAAKLKRRISVNLRVSLFQTLHGADLSLFEQRTAGEISNAFLTETHRTLNAVDHLLLFGQRASIALFYLIALIWISLPLTLFAVLVGTLIGTLITFVYRRLSKTGIDLTESNKKLSSVLLESFAGVRVVRATHAQIHESSRFQAACETQAALEERSARSSAMLTPIVETLAVAGAIVIIGGAYLLLVQTGRMLSSHLSGFAFILVRLVSLMNQLYGMQGYLLYLAGGVKAVEQWLQSPQHPHRPFGQRAFTEVHSAIRFKFVGYVYPNGKRGLENVTMEIPAGKTVALVGESGSGKSTIASLLLRFRAPTEGTIEVDGTDYWEFSPATWHQNVAVVEQEAFLFHDTLSNNIGYGFPDVSRDAVQLAIKRAHLDDVVTRLPEGLETIVGERGTMLSGGQRQRLAIARALVRDPKILILDEATSALDSISEKQVQAAIREAQEGRTVVVIAHRLSTIRHADHIVVLSQGRVVEQGTWEELEQLNGTFSRFIGSGALAT